VEGYPKEVDVIGLVPPFPISLDKAMIRVTPALHGGVEVEAYLERQPSIYLDQDSLSDLATTPNRRARFIGTFQKKGTLLFSWTNALDLSGPQGRSAVLIKSFLDELGAHWIPLEINPWRVERKESGAEPSSGTPCVSESFLRAYYPHIHGDPLTLGKIVDLINQDRDKFLTESERLKHEAYLTVASWRARYNVNPAGLDRFLPSLRYNPEQPATFILREMERLVTREAKSHKWKPNDGVDFMHAIVSAAYGDFVLLDKHWKARVSKVAPPRSYPWLYYRFELDDFLEAFEKCEVQTGPRDMGYRP